VGLGDFFGDIGEKLGKVAAKAASFAEEYLPFLGFTGGVASLAEPGALAPGRQHFESDLPTFRGARVPIRRAPVPSLGKIRGLLGSPGAKAALKSALKYGGLAAGAYGASEYLEEFVPGAVETITGSPYGRRRRRMNPCNPKALRRSLRRVEAFQHFARRSGLLARVTRVKQGRGRFRRKRR
jgi:hypothetical protein